jgi:hypothetical protein
MKKKQIKKIAEQIVQLEKNLQDKNNSVTLGEIEKEMTSLVMDLSMEDLLEIDEYIMSKNLLTK